MRKILSLFTALTMFFAMACDPEEENQDKVPVNSVVLNKNDKCKVLVQNASIAVTSVTLDKTEIELEIGASEQLTATVLPEDATDKTVHWSCSNTSVATVSDGMVTRSNVNISLT